MWKATSLHPLAPLRAPRYDLRRILRNLVSPISQVVTFSTKTSAQTARCRSHQEIGPAFTDVHVWTKKSTTPRSCGTKKSSKENVENPYSSESYESSPRNLEISEGSYEILRSLCVGLAKTPQQTKILNGESQRTKKVNESFWSVLKNCCCKAISACSSISGSIHWLIALHKKALGRILPWRKLVPHRRGDRRLPFICV